jgi:hypothetical protein
MKTYRRGNPLSQSGGRVGERLCWALGTLLLLGAIGPWVEGQWHRRPALSASAVGSRQTAQPADCLTTKSIEAIKPGDRVLSRDPATGTTTLKPVVEVYRRKADHLRILAIQSGSGVAQELRTTDNHPFWVPDTGWVDAGQLQAGQTLLQPDGSVAKVLSTRREEHPEGVPVFNFQTADYHTYFVAQSRDVPAVLAHNDCKGDIPKIEPGDEVPEGLSADATNPSYRTFKAGDSILEYAVNGSEMKVDWVESGNGGSLASMLKSVLSTEGQISKIVGYTTEKLGNASDAAVQRLGNQVANALGEGWTASVEWQGQKRYLILEQQ